MGARAVRLWLALWSRRRLLGLALVAALAAVWGLGLLLFVRAGAGGGAPVVVTLPRLEFHPDGEHNLVARGLGPTLRASSYFRDPISQHHPAFLVDGRAHPGVREKWAPDPTDFRPWLELLWSGEREIRRVRLEHAGSVESSDLTSRRYTLTCLGSRTFRRVVVTGNHAPVTEHSLSCLGAKGLRIDFVPNAPGALVRLFEVEVWGR